MAVQTRRAVKTSENGSQKGGRHGVGVTRAEILGGLLLMKQEWTCGREVRI